jgi:GT2 family glycosyltransferase/glycosyltransferase involved in cell wall biosynthesis
MGRRQHSTLDEIWPAAHGASSDAASIRVLLRISTLQAVESALRGGVSRPARHSLHQIRYALHTGAVVAALRDIDRAWRTLPKDASMLAPIYGRLLSFDEGDPDAALHLLHRGAEAAPDADIAALTVRMLLLLRRAGDAKQALGLALQRFCLLPDGLLGYIATEVLRHGEIQAVGWVGLGPALEFNGELAPSESVSALQVCLEHGGELIQPMQATTAGGPHRFTFKSPQAARQALLYVASRGVPLLGSGCRIPCEFGLDGRADTSGRYIKGWSRLRWLPARPLRLRFEDERGACHQARSKSIPTAGFRWPFQIDPRDASLGGDRINISAQLPDGRWQSLPDTPLLFERAVRPTETRSPPPRSNRPTPSGGQRAKWVDIIIPVYRGLKETLDCINSVLASAVPQACVLVIDDATDEPALATALDALAASGNITLLRNTTNQGFVAAVNRALQVHPTHDAVLLNSDTMVFGDWLRRLRAAAYSAPGVGTATPFSNNGTIVSYPIEPGSPITHGDAAALQALAAATHPGVSIEIPVGVGFCFYLRRDCLSDIGNFDASVFGRGYGEETDFCLRARARGWSHRLAADVFVYHAGGLSFGSSREALLTRSERLLKLRYPGYQRLIADFLTKDPLHGLRRELDEKRLAAVEERFVLLVTLALSGGVDRFVAERCRRLREQGLFPLVLRPAQAGDTQRCKLWTDAIHAPNLSYEVPAELVRITVLLGRLEITALEIQHFLDLDRRLIDAVLALGLPCDVFVHDYAWICPRVTLIDGSGRYCGEPAVHVCDVCVRRNGSNLAEDISVTALRQRSTDWLRQARRVFAPSVDTARRFQRHFPALTVDVRPLSTPAIETHPRPIRAAKSLVRVALIGAIGVHKGYRILLACARDARARGLPLEFVVIGYTEHDALLLKTGAVFITGRYTEGEAPYLLRREQPDLTFLASVWPETWCYALDHALAAGLPIVAFDLGAIAERLRVAGVGVLLPRELSASQINDRLLQIAAANRASKREGAKTMVNQSEGGCASSEDGLSASVQVLPMPAGLYLVSVTAAGATQSPNDGRLSLPALHVGVGPGVRSEQVEFMAGSNTHGAWLFAPSDLVVVKVNSNPATLILTSVRAPGGEVLSIKIERLDARAEVVTTQSGAALPSKSPVRAPGARPQQPIASPAITPSKTQGLPLQVAAHIRTRGDMSFAEVPWAGRLGTGLWIESFSVRPLEHFEAKDIEYKGLTGSGFETRWISNDVMCGTKGMSVPLVGFALRLKPNLETAAYDCEYSGYFQSGVTVGPLRNGAPCHSTVANDPLEGIQVRIVQRVTSTTALPVDSPRTPAEPVQIVASASPRRTSHSTAAQAARVMLASVDADKPARASPRKSNRGGRSSPRIPTRRP